MNADILILGAGIAGLRCGIEILKKRPSLKIAIIEKYNYSGGRVVTYHKKIQDIRGKCSTVQWENGAGRVHKSHTKVLSLLKHYTLHTYPMQEDLLYEEDGILTKNIFTETMKLLTQAVQQLSDEYLATHTLRELLLLILGEKETEALLNQFPYRAEVDTLRADFGMESFEEEMGTYKGYVGVKEGLSALIKAMVSDFESRGGTVFHQQEVIDIQKNGSMILVKTKTPSGDVLWEAPRVICALHKDAYSEIPFFQKFHVLNHLQMEPLVRTYAIFPLEKGKAWFADLPKIVSAGPVRFFIPMDSSCGTIMLSYTDGKDAKKVLHMLDTIGEEKTGETIVDEVRKMFPDRTIPDPLFFKAHPWTSGCTYWLPGEYDPVKESREALKPFSDMNLYCCGESFSLLQAWMEGALDHADLLLDTYFN